MRARRRRAAGESAIEGFADARGERLGEKGFWITGAPSGRTPRWRRASPA